MVTSRTVAAVMRAMAFRQSEHLRKERPMLATVTPYWKTLAAFVALVVTNLVTQLTTTGAVWPSTTKGWVALVLTTVGGTITVYVKGNTTTDPKQAAGRSVALKRAE